MTDLSIAKVSIILEWAARNQSKDNDGFEVVQQLARYWFEAQKPVACPDGNCPDCKNARLIERLTEKCSRLEAERDDWKRKQEIDWRQCLDAREAFSKAIEQRDAWAKKHLDAEAALAALKAGKCGCWQEPGASERAHDTHCPEQAASLINGYCKRIRGLVAEVKREHDLYLTAHRENMKGAALLMALRTDYNDVLAHARHAHRARYATQGPSAGKLMDSCDHCGLDVRHKIHAVPEEPTNS